MSSVLPRRRQSVLNDLDEAGTLPAFEGSDDGNPAARRTVQLTWWRFLNSVVLLTFGTTKTVAAYQDRGSVANNFDMALGLIWAFISYWGNLIEAEHPTLVPWLFQTDIKPILAFPFSALIFGCFVFAYFFLTFTLTMIPMHAVSHLNNFPLLLFVAVITQFSSSFLLIAVLRVAVLALWPPEVPQLGPYFWNRIWNPSQGPAPLLLSPLFQSLVFSSTFFEIGLATILALTTFDKADVRLVMASAFTVPIAIKYLLLDLYSTAYRYYIRRQR